MLDAGARKALDEIGRELALLIGMALRALASGNTTTFEREIKDLTIFILNTAGITAMVGGRGETQGDPWREAECYAAGEQRARKAIEWGLKTVANARARYERRFGKIVIGFHYLMLRQEGKEHNEACKEVAKTHGKGISTIEHCVGPTRRELVSQQVVPDLAKLANAGKKKPGARPAPYVGKEQRRRRKRHHISL
jgi:hypothetical protein